MYKTIFFDLDGTLLGMNDEHFLKLYFETMIKYANEHGLNGTQIADLIELGTVAMMKNQGNMTNESIFWKAFEENSNIKREDVEELFNQYYLTEFKKVEKSCYAKPESAEIVDVLKQKGYRLFLMTNAIFPRVATLKRMEWAKLNPQDFEIVTTYEHCYYCKPNPMYYKTIIDQYHLNSEEILMVGNDVFEDGIIQTLGVDCYFVTDTLLNRRQLEIKSKYISDIKGLLSFVKELPSVK